MPLNRRTLLMAAASLAALPAIPAPAQARPAMHVRKDPDCGCCGDWIAILREAGFDLTVQEMPNADLARFKLARGIAPDLASCHTAEIAGYVVEGHVPPADIDRLLAERPDAVGLSVPGMPWGAPGMGPESERDAYDVVLIGRDGGRTVFSRYDAA